MFHWANNKKKTHLNHNKQCPARADCQKWLQYHTLRLSFPVSWNMSITLLFWRLCALWFLFQFLVVVGCCVSLHLSMRCYPLRKILIPLVQSSCSALPFSCITNVSLPSASPKAQFLLLYYLFSIGVLKFCAMKSLHAYPSQANELVAHDYLLSASVTQMHEAKHFYLELWSYIAVLAIMCWWA